MSDIEDDIYHIQTKRLVIAEKETDEDDEDNTVKYFVTNKIDTPTKHVIRSYVMRWRIKTFFEDSKQNLGLGNS